MEIYNNLPFEIRLLVDNYSVQHRMMYSHVMSDLVDKTKEENTVYCDNYECCENLIDIRKSSVVQSKFYNPISGMYTRNLYFCSRNCCRYSFWESHHDSIDRAFKRNNITPNWENCRGSFYPRELN